MKNTLTAIAALSLTACASTQTVMGKDPKETFTTDRAPEDVAFCLGNKNDAPVLPRGDGSHVVLIKNGYGAVSMAFAVYPDGDGSRIEYRKQFGTVGGIWKQCVGLKGER